MQFPLFRTCQSLAIIALLTACGGGGSGGSGSGGFGSNISVTATNNNVANGVFRPAVADSPYKAKLVDCVKIVNDAPANNCKLSSLPFIGQKSSAPTKADILAQTVVSHPWMAVRFEQLLDQMPQDIFLLFRGVTAVVIGADIRPSHYRSDTGAIYLDPADLWLIASERATISKAEDFRSGFSNGLAFRSLWRYVQGKSDAFGYFPLDGSVSTRLISDIVRPMGDLLFHELAHANDFMPPAYVAQVDPQSTPSDAINALSNVRTSTALTLQIPLNSQMQFDLGRIMFQGVTATAAQKQLTAEQVGLDFAIDGASDSYNYASQFEDTAMLFEEVMMKYHFNVDREVAFTDAPPATGASCANYVVRWGVINRIGQPLVKSRAQVIVQKILGINDSTIYFATLPAPRSMLIGVDWCSNLNNMNSRDGVMQKMSLEQLSERNLLPID
jgi:hypothetical protein